MVSGRAWHQLPQRVVAGVPQEAGAPVPTGSTQRSPSPCASARAFAEPSARPRRRKSSPGLAVGHGAPTEPLDGPRARRTWCRREGPRCSGP